ncbi:uncharacterized protein [Polyergus mexicanus]|uniref:uncharacterized protein n=1 Tax=Polyergus mexicanus TaxID=615972 RepID=UPI0038B67307
MKIQHIICILCIGLGVLLCTNLFLQFQQSERPSLTLYYGIGICRYIVSTFQKRSRTSASNRSSFQRIWHRNLSVQFQQSERLPCLTFYSGIGICNTVLTLQQRSQRCAFQRVGHQDLSAATIRQDLTNWAVQFQISHTAVTALLSILRNHGFDNLPKNCKTMLKTP